MKQNISWWVCCENSPEQKYSWVFSMWRLHKHIFGWQKLVWSSELVYDWLFGILYCHVLCCSCATWSDQIYSPASLTSRASPSVPALWTDRRCPHTLAWYCRMLDNQATTSWMCAAMRRLIAGSQPLWWSCSTECAEEVRRRNVITLLLHLWCRLLVKYIALRKTVEPKYIFSFLLLLFFFLKLHL